MDLSISSNLKIEATDNLSLADLEKKANLKGPADDTPTLVSSKI
jgi:hypothetical protein